MKVTKRELQSSRNRLTAQLSRDRQKIELNFLKTQCINYQRLLRRLNKKISDSKYFCEICNERLSETLQHHQNNLFVRYDNEQTCPVGQNQFEPSLKRARNDIDLPPMNLHESPVTKNKELKRAKIQILSGKRRTHLYTAGLIASSIMYAFSGDKPTSTALMEVDHKEMPILGSNLFDYDLAMDYESRGLSLDADQDK